MQAAMVCNARSERAADCNKVREDVVRLIYLHLSKHEIFFGILLLRKQLSPCLPRGSLAYIFSGWLINVQYVKRVYGKIVPSYQNFLCTAGK